MKVVRRFRLAVLLLLLVLIFAPGRPAPLHADAPADNSRCTLFPSNTIFYLNVSALPTTTDSATMIAFLSTTGGVAGHIDNQFASGNQPNGSHKGFEFT